jgi:hypothetical protein
MLICLVFELRLGTTSTEARRFLFASFSVSINDQKGMKEPSSTPALRAGSTDRATIPHNFQPVSQNGNPSIARRLDVSY